MLTPLQAGMRSASYKLKFIITLLQIGWRKDKNVLKRSFKLWKCKEIYSVAVVQAGKSYGGGLEMSVIKCSDFFFQNVYLQFHSLFQGIPVYSGSDRSSIHIQEHSRHRSCKDRFRKETGNKVNIAYNIKTPPQ